MKLPAVTQEERFEARLHALVINAIGLRRGDCIYVSPTLNIQRATAREMGASFVSKMKDANIFLFASVSEMELIRRVNKLPPGSRVISYSDESQVDNMSLSSFEAATACIFDPNCRKVVRVFDPPRKGRGDYLHIEMSELADSTLSMQATRIASLR
ncbi:hypothetical protein [Erythrobacter aureus]|uniref:Uncharacterized protein n=1 Tax=Erythrobacter aureus TaxID=2182384 RepID=A0A345YIJ1_9SPHN|nr:hypothetical protein [Erythrobacter aureus]AXK43743.1 hypothetical protein DVR09_14900 [Erythrobacter aureus]